MEAGLKRVDSCSSSGATSRRSGCQHATVASRHPAGLDAPMASMKFEGGCFSGTQNSANKCAIATIEIVLYASEASIGFVYQWVDAPVASIGFAYLDAWMPYRPLIIQG